MQNTPSSLVGPKSVPIDAAHRSFRASQISSLYGRYGLPKRGFHSYFHAMENYPGHFGMSRERVENLRRGFATAVANGDVDFDPRELLDDPETTDFLPSPDVFNDEWSEDRSLAVLDLEDTLAREFQATLPEVQCGVDWVMNPIRLLDFAFGSSPVEDLATPLYSEDFRRAFLVGLSKISSPMAFQVMTNNSNRDFGIAPFEIDFKLQIKRQVDVVGYAFYRPPYGQKSALETPDLKNTTAALIEVINRLESARARIASLRPSDLKRAVEHQVSQKLDLMWQTLKVLPKLIEARQIRVGEGLKPTAKEWETYESRFARERARHGLTGPVLSLIEWIRVVNATAVTLGHLAPMFEEPSVTEEPPGVPLLETAAADSPCEPALLEHAPVVDPLELPESQLHMHSR